MAMARHRAGRLASSAARRSSRLRIRAKSPRSSYGPATPPTMAGGRARSVRAPCMGPTASGPRHRNRRILRSSARAFADQSAAGPRTRDPKAVLSGSMLGASPQSDHGALAFAGQAPRATRLTLCGNVNRRGGPPLQLKHVTPWALMLRNLRLRNGYGPRIEPLMKFTAPLPIDPVLNELLSALAAHASAVLVAPPGAGKTTRVPLALMEE